LFFRTYLFYIDNYMFNDSIFSFELQAYLVFSSNIKIVD
jgi:hypothetical protein